LNAAFASFRLARFAWLIGAGLVEVTWRFPALDAEQRHARVGRWARRVLNALRLKVVVHGRLQPAQKLLVANHVSWLDILVLHALCPGARFVAKSEVRAWPAIGSLVAGAGTLFIERGNSRAAARVVDGLAGVLHAGGTVAVFPEGTTTDGRDVLPFHASLLNAACKAACVIQPVSLRYAEAGHAVSPSAPYIDDDSLLGSLWRICASGGLCVTVHLLAPHDAAGADRRALAKQLRSAIVQALGGPSQERGPAQALAQPHTQAPTFVDQRSAM
jgi:1-acyl-sn-glycerol-3-phosphate acyltransferase